MPNRHNPWNRSARIFRTWYYAARLKEVEDALDAVPADATDNFPTISTTDPVVLQLYQRALLSRPLRALWQGVVRLSGQSPEKVAVLAGLADVRPDPDEILRTSDAVFMRILEKYNAAGSVKARGLLQIDLVRLMDLRSRFGDCIPRLVTIAKSPDWTTQMRALETELQRRTPTASVADSAPGSGEDVVTLCEDARVIRDLVWNASTDAEADGFRRAMLDEPSLSRITPELMTAFGKVASTIDETIPQLTSSLGESSLAQKWEGLASQFADGRRSLPDRMKIELGLELRIDAARLFRALRAFAKIVTLTYRWPELAPLLRPGFHDLISLEKELGQGARPGSGPGQTPGRWDRYRGDSRLVNLLSLKPKFLDIFADEYFPLLEVQKLASTAPDLAAGLPMTMTAPPPAKVETAVVAPEAAPASAATVSMSALLAEEFAPVSERRWTDFPFQIRTDSSVSGQYIVSFQPAGETEILERVQPDRSRLETMVQAFRKYNRLTDEVIRTRDLGAAEPLLGAQLREPGRNLFESFFTGEVLAKFRRMLEQGSRNVRVLLKLNDAWLERLPWEALFDPELRVSIGLTLRCSLVRSVVDPIKEMPRPFRPPLRVLLVLPEPDGVPRLAYAREEMEVLERILSEREQQVTLEKLVGKQAGPDGFRRALRRFKPHVFHFIGHGQFDTTTNSGRLIFQKDGEETIDSMYADDLATFLRDRSLGIAILNGCDTGTASNNDVLTSVAASIVNAGVPAAIATMREVPDEAALIFTRELFRAIVDGETVETAIVEARQALSAERWNWSSYALFSSRTNLDSLRLLGKPDRRALSTGAVHA